LNPQADKQSAGADSPTLQVVFQSTTLRNERGQSSIFILSLVGVVLLCAVFLYQSGKITSEKMQLQNAADAAAYGASVLEARSLNFAAYTNRAMVANEVAIGQMVGVLSWIDELKSMGEYMSDYADFIDAFTSWLYAVVTVGDVIEAIIDVITQALDVIGQILTDVGETLESVLNPIVSVAIRGLSVVNQVYSTSQTVYHGATIVLVTDNIFQCLQDNVPGTSYSLDNFFIRNRPGAQLSDLGIIALAGHIPSFWSGYTRRYTQPKDEESEGEEGKDKKKKKTLEDNGMARLAATIREGRDPFSSGGSPISDKNIYGFDTDYYNRDWKLGLGHDFHYDVDIRNLHILEVEGDVNIFFGIDSKEGTEIRAKDDAYTWSAVDTVMAGGEVDFSSIIFKILTYKYDIPAGSIDLGLPLGGGIYQAAGSEQSLLNQLDMVPPLPDLPEYDRVKADGSAGSGERRLLAYTITTAGLEENTVDGNPYGGLRP